MDRQNPVYIQNYPKFGRFRFRKFDCEKQELLIFFSHYYIINHFQSLDVAVNGLAK